MAPSISGHGGEFELVDEQGAFIPAIDFTLPSADVWVQVGNEPIRRPKPAPSDPEFTIPAGYPAQIKHPNDHPTDRVKLNASFINQGDFKVAAGTFKIYQSPSEEASETMNFEVRHYTKAPLNQNIELVAAPGKPPAVHFTFNAEADWYVAVIVYNFRALQNPPYDTILLQTPTGTKEEADRDCYVYIAFAKDELNSRNPQAPSHDRKTLQNASLTLNVKELGVLMAESPAEYEGSNETLYHAPAQQIHNSMLNFNRRIISLTPISQQDADMSQGVTYTADATTLAAAGITEFPLGLYIVANPLTYLRASLTAPANSSAQTDNTTGTQQNQTEPTLVNLNTANEAELIGLPGIKSVLAGRIITYREQTPFTAIEELMAVSGIKDGIFAKLASRITV